MKESFITLFSIAQTFNNAMRYIPGSILILSFYSSLQLVIKKVRFALSCRFRDSFVFINIYSKISRQYGFKSKTRAKSIL